MKYVTILILIVHALLEVDSFYFPSEDLVLPVVVSSRIANNQKPEQDEDYVNSRMKVTTTVSNRFATTEIKCMFRNTERAAKEIAFSPVLPKNAFISRFTMEVDGKSYAAAAGEKDKALHDYSTALKTESSSGFASVRDANRFDVSLNVAAGKNVVYTLVYDELLEKKRNKYEVVTNLYQSSFIEDLRVEVKIGDTAKLEFVGTPSLRTGKEAVSDHYHQPNSTVDIIDEHNAVVVFTPSRCDQFLTMEDLKTQRYGVQFVVEYALDRNTPQNQVMVNEEHFVYFFSPTGLPSMQKKIVFVAGAADAVQMDHFRHGITRILDTLSPDDMFNVLFFSDGWRAVYNVSQGTTVAVADFWELATNPVENTYASAENVTKMKQIVNSWKADASEYATVKFSVVAVAAGITIADSNEYLIPLILFFYGGDVSANMPTEIAQYNLKVKKPAMVFPMSFGKTADILERIALKTSGKHHHIYQEADGSIQILNSYNDISYPTLSDLEFKFDESIVIENTTHAFPVYFAGTELVVSGKIRDVDKPFTPSLTAKGKTANYQYIPELVISNDQDLKKIHEYLTLRQKIQEHKISAEADKLKNEIVERAVKDSYVTPLTASVVSKPGNVNEYATLVDAAVEGTVANDPTLTDWVMSEVGISELLNVLPWLQEIMNRDNTITVDGVRYNIGYNKSLRYNYECLRYKTKRICVSLQKCITYAVSFESPADYLEHFCPLERFAGICCPKQ